MKFSQKKEYVKYTLLSIITNEGFKSAEVIIIVKYYISTIGYDGSVMKTP